LTFGAGVPRPKRRDGGGAPKILIFDGLSFPKGFLWKKLEIQTFVVFLITFFACAKKVTKKAQPILMPSISSIEHFLGQNRQWGIELHRAV
jgi:hypothetical protein